MAQHLQLVFQARAFDLVAQPHRYVEVLVWVVAAAHPGKTDGLAWAELLD